MPPLVVGPIFRRLARYIDVILQWFRRNVATVEAGDKGLIYGERGHI